MSDPAQGSSAEDAELAEVKVLLAKRQELMQVLDRQMREQSEVIQRDIKDRTRDDASAGGSPAPERDQDWNEEGGKGHKMTAVLEADVLFERKSERAVGDPTLLEDRDFLMREMKEQQRRSLGIVSGYMTSAPTTVKAKMSKMLRAIKKKIPLGERENLSENCSRQEYQSSVGRSAERRSRNGEREAIDIGDIRNEDSDDDEEVKRLQRELADLEHTVRSEDRDDETDLLKQLEEINSLANLMQQFDEAGGVSGNSSLSSPSPVVQTPPVRTPAPRDASNAMKLESMLAGISALEFTASPTPAPARAPAPQEESEPMC